MAATDLTRLATAISSDIERLEEYFIANNVPLPSFEEHSPPELPLTPEMQQIRQRAIDSAIELQDLLRGPVMLLRPYLNATSLHAIYRYDIASKVPLDGQIFFAELAEKVNIQRPDLERVLRFAMIHPRVCQEKDGAVRHTAASRLLAESPGAMACLGFMFDECYQAFAHTVEAMGLRNDPVSAPTSQLDAQGGLLVDVGGANGHAAVAVARANPNIRCVVQDIPEVVDKAEARYAVLQEVAGRVTFAAHDFFQPQPVVAQIYLLRLVFQNWDDGSCIAILRALMPALRPGARVVINNSVLPPAGTSGTLPPTKERAVRSLDVIMMSLFNSRERDAKDLEALFTAADARFTKIKVWQPTDSQLGLAEATWEE